jgi:hypothetical protein
MDFRWVALIALWTLISGPILGVPTGPAKVTRSADQKAKVVKVEQQIRR